MIKLQIEGGRLGHILQRYYNFVRQRDRVVLDDLKSRDLFHPSLTAAKIIGYIGAVIIHSTTIILPLIGLWIIISRLAGAFSVCYGLLILGLAYVIRPRLATRPSDSISRTEYPKIYAFVNQISDTLNAPCIDVIVIDGDTNASLGTFGLHQSTVLTIGYPLWKQLTEQERVALIGHELAHQINKDSTRGLIIGSALDTLMNWYRLLYPNRRPNGLDTFFSIPFKLIFWAIANSVLVIFLALYQVLLYERRRAEYLADYMGATVGGTQSMISLLTKLKNTNGQVTMSTVITHPSHDFRIEFLTSKKDMPPKFVLEPEYAKQIDNELSKIGAAINKRTRRAYNDYI